MRLDYRGWRRPLHVLSCFADSLYKHIKMSQLSLVHGPTEPALWVDKTLCAVINQQESSFPDRTALIVPWESTRLTYRQLADRSRVVAKALFGAGLRHGDCIGIMDGNSYEYIEVFLGAARIGCPVVVLNNTYSPDELRNAVYRSCTFYPNITMSDY